MEANNNFEKLGLTTKEATLSKEHQQNMYSKLEHAMKISNTEHEKSKIIYKEKGETKSLLTSIWFVSEKYVCVHAGVILLISNILDVVV